MELEGEDVLSVLATFFVAWALLLFSGDVAAPLDAGGLARTLPVITTVAHITLVLAFLVFGIVGVLANRGRRFQQFPLRRAIILSMAIFAVVGAAWILRAAVALEDLRMALWLAAITVASEGFALRKLLRVRFGGGGNTL